MMMTKLNETGIGALIIVIILALITSAGAGIYLFTSKSQQPQEETPPLEEAKQIKKTTMETGEAESPFGKFTMTSDVMTTENCNTEGCFYENFATCTPATLDAESSFGSIHYEILKPENSGCNVKMMYTKNPNPDWVNKEMVCTMDNAIKFEESIANSFNDAFSGNENCTGELVEVIQNT